jgi:hypothetical protein
MKYIFVSGAPGSKWSSVVKNIYYSPSIDSSDAAPHREYYHDASGEYQLMHMGAYWGPAMEFGDWFENLDQHSKQENEAEFDRPFSGSGIRIIKSHVFGYHIDYIKRTWPDCPVVLVDRSDDACLGWWVKCGEFNITYPLYRDYYLDLRQMAQCIRRENEGNRRGAREWPAQTVSTNLQLARLLGIADPPAQYRQDYLAADIGVTVV